jgi:hypothetical protein
MISCKKILKMVLMSTVRTTVPSAGHNQVYWICKIKIKLSFLKYPNAKFSKIWGPEQS